MKALIGIVCDAAGIAPATVTSIVAQGLSGLASAGHEPHLQVLPAAGNPDAARCLLATQALAGRFDVVLLVDSGVWCEQTGVLDLCEAAHRRGAAIGTLLPPALESEGGKFAAVSASLIALPLVALEALAPRLPKIEQGFYPFFVPAVREVAGRQVLCPSGWTLCLDLSAATGRPPEVLVGLRVAWAMPATPSERPASKRRAPAREMAYPVPRLPVEGYLTELRELAGKLKPEGDRVSMQAPPAPLARPVAARSGQRIRVALVNTCMLAGGAERQTCTLAAGLDSRRFDVAVINAHPEQGTHRPLAEMLAAANVPCYQGVEHPAIDAADVVLWWGPALSRRAKAGLRQPTVHVVHSDSHWTARAMLECESFLGEVVGVSGPAAAMAADVLGRPRESVRVIWNGIDAADLGTKPRPAWTIGGPFAVGWLGRLSDEKNPIAVLAAVAQLPPRFRLRMYGAGPLADFCKAAAGELGIADRVELMGVTEDRGAALTIVDCLVLASLFEGLPLTIIEAMWVGVPVIAPPHGDVPLVLAHGRGAVAEPWPAELAAAIETLALTPPGQVAGDVLAARAFAAEHFNLARMVDSYSAIFEELACRS